MFGRRESKPPSERPDAQETGGARESGAAPQDVDAARSAEYERVLADLASVALERDQAKADYLRALAEYQNYQRRALSNEQEARRQGVTSVLSSVLPVLDHFDMALSQKADSDATQRVIDGVKVIRQELIRALERHGVCVISPSLGETPDHSRHSVLMHRPAEGVEPGRISSVMQVGYSLEGRMVRPAMVTVAPEAESHDAPAEAPPT